jgi:hypothetical protein
MKSSSGLELITVCRRFCLCSCNGIAEINNFGFGAVLLPFLVSELQKLPSPVLEPRTVFRGLAFVSVVYYRNKKTCMSWSFWEPVTICKFLSAGFPGWSSTYNFGFRGWAAHIPWRWQLQCLPKRWIIFNNDRSSSPKAELVHICELFVSICTPNFSCFL